MATEISMPKLSDTMTEGQLGTWRKSVGEKIERGEIIAEVETDKATMELEAFASGILLEQRVQAGELVPVGTVIGLIGLPDELKSLEAPIEKVSPAQTTTVPDVQPEQSVAPASPIREEPLHPAAVQTAPIVRRRAAELGIDLAAVAGSGPEGRILLEDLEQLPRIKPAVGQPAAVADAASAERPQPAPAGRNITAEPLSRMRAAITRVTTDSWRSIPHFYISIEVEMELAEKIVRGLKSEGIAVSLNALILAAVAAALVKCPGLNATLTDQGLLRYAEVNLGFAVAVEGGLLVPVIKGAEKLGARELNDQAAGLAAKARAGSISEDEISGGSFSVSNLGMYGIDSFASIIMPSQAGILAVGAVTDRPVARNGKLEIRRVMSATLSCDHRIIDGVYAAAFLNEFKRLLEHPAELPA